MSCYDVIPPTFFLFFFLHLFEISGGPRAMFWPMESVSKQSFNTLFFFFFAIFSDISVSACWWERGKKQEDRKKGTKTPWSKLVTGLLMDNSRLQHVQGTPESWSEQGEPERVRLECLLLSMQPCPLWAVLPPPGPSCSRERMAESLYFDFDTKVPPIGHIFPTQTIKWSIHVTLVDNGCTLEQIKRTP